MSKVSVPACALALACAAAPLPAPAVDDAAALLLLHKAYVGWQLDDGTFATLKVRESLRSVAADGTQTEKFAASDVRRGLLHRESLDLSGLRHDSGFTGRLFWSANENGFTVPRHDSRRDIELATLAFFAEGMTTMKTLSVKRESLDGASVAIVRVTMPFDLVVDLYEDPATGAFRRVVFDPAKRAETLVIDAYTEVLPGKRLVTSWHEAGSKLREVDTVTPNPPVSDADVKPPPASASWTFGTSEPFHIEATQSRIIVDAVVNGVRGRFFLDTGAGAIAVSTGFAARAKLQTVASTEIGGLTGSARGTIAKAATIAFGDGSTLHDVIVYTGFLPSSGSDSDVVGLLGFDFLAGALVDVDLDKQRLAIFDPAKVAPNEAGAAVVTPDLTSGVPYVPAVLDGGRNVRALFDMGNEAPVLISGALRNDVKLFSSSGGGSLKFNIDMSGAAGGQQELQCGELARIQMGRLNYDDAPACYLPDFAENEAIVGFDLLRHFNYTFDYPEGKIVMTQRKL
jgi:predicted aspartyl protease